jgi:L-cysteine desulfidase
MITDISNGSEEDTDQDLFVDLLHKELVIAMGCTEPAAAALAAASARRALGVSPEKILVRASRDIIKNAMNVGIPNTALKGISIAVALGLENADPVAGLNILSHITPAQEKAASRMVDSCQIKLERAENVPSIFIEVRLQADEKVITARIQEEHNKVEVFDGDKKISVSLTGTEKNPEILTPSRIFVFTDSVPLEKIEFLIHCAQVNLELAEYSVKTSYGISVGKTMFEGSVDGGEGGLFYRGASLAAAASDARMAGCAKPVVINSGSGNQGITVSVPVLVLAQGLKRNRDETARALCLSHLTALMMTARKDRLSALCGAFTAAIGTGAGFVRLLGGDNRAVMRCIQNMVGNLMGIICDGAKGSCALKIFTCVEAAELGAKLAMSGNSVPESEGILGNTLEDTLGIVEKISHKGMIPLDETILEIMLEKSNSNSKKLEGVFQ